MRSLKRSGRRKTLLVGANVIKNHEIQKKTTARALEKYNIIPKETPIAKKDAGVRSVFVVKKALGKSWSKVNPTGNKMTRAAYPIT